MNLSSWNQTIASWSKDTFDKDITPLPLEQCTNNEFFYEEESDFVEAFDTPPLKVVTLIIYFLLVPIGCLLHFLVIHYEQFGGDPQKRSIFNQIIAYIAAFEILNALVSEHILVMRVFYGCLPIEIATLHWFSVNFKNSVVVTFITVSLMYRTMRIFSFKRVAGLNDKVVSIFILLATALNNFLYVVMYCMLGGSQSHQLTKIMACGQIEERIDFDQR